MHLSVSLANNKDEISEALAALAQHDWPGNVRELENRVKRAVIMSDDALVTLGDIDLAEPEDIPDILNLAQAREEAERREIPRALRYAIELPSVGGHTLFCDCYKL